MHKQKLVGVYILMVGVPLFGLFGILEAGRSITPPLSIGGEWTIQCDGAGPCASVPDFAISQSATEAQIKLHDKQMTTFEATIKGTAVTSTLFEATISGKLSERTLSGTLRLDGSAPVAFRAVRQASKKTAE